MTEYSVGEAIAAADWISHMRTPYKGILEDAARAYAEHLSTHPHSPDAADSRRVTSAMVAQFKTAFHEHSAISPEYDGCIRVGLEAVLAAQGQGEPVPFGYLIKSAPPYAGMEMIWRFEPEERYAKDAAESMPIFTHTAPPASPAGVPDDDVRWLLGQLRHNEFSHSFVKDERQCEVCKRIKAIHAKLAAPSATPEGGEGGL